MLKKIFNVSVYVFAVFGFIFTLLVIFLAIRDSSNKNSTNGNNTSKVGQSIMGSKKTVAKTEKLYSDKNIKITRTGGNVIIDNLTDKKIIIESTFVINNSIEAKPVGSFGEFYIDPKGKRSISISEFIAVNPGQKVEESDEKAEKAEDGNYYKHKMKSGENIGWTANIKNDNNDNYDTMNSFSKNFNY